MRVLKKLSGVMANPTVYRLWQAPVVKAKFAPVLRHNDMSTIKRVLDVGCGPGTNASFFTGLDYLGLDLNPDYIEQAISRYGMRFELADVCTYQADEGNKFDFILMNSLLHHIDTEHVRRILRQLTRQLTPDGHVHILDLVLPDEDRISRRMALADRGDFPRPLQEWAELFCEVFDKVVLEPYPIKTAGVELWSMVYFKGKLS